MTPTGLEQCLIPHWQSYRHQARPVQQSNAFWLGSGQCTINHQGLFLRGPLGEYQSRDTSITSLVFNRVPICWLFYSLVVIVRCKFPSFYPSRHPRWVTINSRKVIQRYGCDFSIMVLHMCGLGWWHGPPITHVVPENLVRSGPVFCNLWPSKVSANEREHYTCNIFPHWVRPCPTIDIKWRSFGMIPSVKQTVSWGHWKQNICWANMGDLSLTY